MAAQELAENITKYSTGSNVTLQVELEKQDDEHVMRGRKGRATKFGSSRTPTSVGSREA
jgi:hypothetical protein